MNKGNSTYFVLDEFGILDEEHARREKANRKKKNNS